MQHVPVLRTEVLQILSPQPGETVLDCTLGLGGHAALFLQATAPDGRLIGLDADAGNLNAAQKNLSHVSDRTEFHRMNFRDAASLGKKADILFADLGVSSPHVDDPTRGFTFRVSAPLDLRYDQSSGQTAEEFILSASDDDLATVFSEFGELQRSRQLAKALHAHLQRTTDDVVHCVEKVFTYRAPRVLPQVFQALRIAVNDELGALRSLLSALPTLLNPGGRAGIISYHSLEDRMVKQKFRTLTAPVLEEMTGQIAVRAPFDLLTRKALTASVSELEENPRSRSARFRAIRRSS